MSASALVDLECGAVISTPVVLNKDLVCEKSPVITIVGPDGSLDMNKHSVTHDGDREADEESVGIVHMGQGAALSHGTVSGFYVGVEVSGTGGHHIENMIVVSHEPDSSAGFMVKSNDNDVGYNMAMSDNAEDSNGDHRGFYVLGANNWFHNNTATESTGDGFNLGKGADNNKFHKNIASHNKGDGFDLNGANHNKLSQNRAEENSRDGFDVDTVSGEGGNYNSFLANVSIKNKDDGFDIDGNYNRLIWNSSNDNGDPLTEPRDYGFSVDGIGNQLRFNTANNNTAHGIYLNGGKSNKVENNWVRNNDVYGIAIKEGSLDNQVVQNIVTNNRVNDLEDFNACDMNIWKANFHHTSNFNCP